MKKSVTLLLVLVFLIATGVANIQPIKAASGKFTVKNVDQLMYALYWATNGDVILIMNGTYDTPQGKTLTITKSISLVGEDADGTIIRLHPAWKQQGWNYVIPMYGFDDPMEIQGIDVKISGLTISSDGGSILATGTRLQIRNCKIATYLLANGHYQNISQNTMTGGIGCYGSFNTIAGNRIAGGGVIVGGSSGSSNMIYDNIVTDGGDGITLIDYGQPYVNGNLFFNNTVKNCSFGLVVWLNGYSSNNTVYHNNFIGNDQQVNTQYSGFLDNGKEGNYWSDYGGKDANGDGVGDTPYGKDRYPLMYPWGAPDVSVLSVENTTYSGSVFLNFTVNKPTLWIGYSLDGLDNVTVIGNTTLTGLSSGLHNVTVYVKDMFENTGTSETITFTIAEEPKHEPFPTILVAAASVAIVAVAGAGLLVYFKKRKH